MLTFIGISVRILHPRFLPRHNPGYNTPKKHEEYKAMKNVNAYTGPQRFAHRGLVQAAPENTLGAFQGAVDGGYEGIEIDVQMTRDGEIVIAHDSNFTRMTLGHPDGGSNRRIRDLTWDEIQKIELPYANHLLSEAPPEHSEIQLLATLPKLVMGQVEGRDYETALAEDGRMAHLMRFSDFDAWLTAQSRSITVEVEVKAPGLAGPILELLSRSPNTGSYILFSGDPVYVEEMQAAVRKNGKPTGLRMGANMRRLTEETKRMIPNMDLFEVGLNADAFTCEDVRWLGEHGIHVFSNLGDYPDWWEKMVTRGVLGFKTNYAAAYTNWWNSRH